MSAVTKDELRDIIVRLKNREPVSVKTSTGGHWSFMFTPQGTKTRCVPPIPVNLFTAKVVGSTTEADWGTLGAVAHELGIPLDVLEKYMDPNPEATHRIMWANP
jgi:hypothetical protein